jgi:hypothetical protein
MDDVHPGHRVGHGQVRGKEAQHLVLELVPRLVRHRALPVRALAVHGQIHQAG